MGENCPKPKNYSKLLGFFKKERSKKNYAPPPKFLATPLVCTKILKIDLN